jgi:diaminopimelate epimerase
MIRRTTTAPAASGALQFAKMSGAGNDFVVIDNRQGVVGDAGDLTRRISTRRISVGADGLILIEPSIRATFRMRYFNADGSEADFCANGTRCAARFAFMNVIAPKRMTIETGAGVITAEMSEQQQVTLFVGAPSEFVRRRTLRLSTGREIHGSYLRVGVPHYVIFIREALWEHDIDAIGSEIRRHPELPDGANVNFVQVRGRDALSVRTWERGVEAETLACGSGVVASVTTAALLDRVDSPVRVLTRSGITLGVQFEKVTDGDGERIDNIRLTGDARVIYRGELTPEAVSGFDPEWVRHPTEPGPRT